MSTLCVNSGITYSDLAAADAAEGGTDYLVPTEYHQSGESTPNVNFSAANYPSSYIIRAVAGEETTGQVGVGALVSGTISSLVDGGQISDIRTTNLNMGTTPNATLRRLVIDAGSGSTDGVTFNDTINAEDILIFNCNDGFLSSVVRQNSNINKCTVIGATRFGYAQGRFTNCVDINSANQGYFNEASSSSGTWEHDGSGTDSITESPPTDIFVDFASGDYRILADSSVGTAGAGAFIQSSAPIEGVTSEGGFLSTDSTVEGLSESTVSTDGAFQASDSVLTGVSVTTLTTSGVFTPDDSIAVGLSEIAVDSIGNFLSEDSIVQGSSGNVLTSVGTFEANVSILTGVSSTTVPSLGSFESEDSTTVGNSNTSVPSLGSFESEDSTTVGNSTTLVSTLGIFNSEDSQITGISALSISSLGEFNSSDSVVEGTESPVINSTGSFLTNPSVVTGSSSLLINTAGSFISTDSVVRGTDVQDIPSIFEGVLSVERITLKYTSVNITPKYSSVRN